MDQSSQPHQSPPHQAQPEDEPATAVKRSIPHYTGYIFFLAIVSTFVAAIVLLVMGFVETFSVVAELLQGHTDMNTVRVHFIETIDIFLLATTL